MSSTVQPAAAGVSSPRILVVDDAAANRRLMETIFAAEGYRVACAADGSRALDLLEREPADVVVLDLRLPGLTGLETLSAMRAREPALPIIMVTAFGDIPAAVEATRLGAYDFLTRPLSNELLVHRVRRAVDEVRLRGQVEALRGQLSDRTLATRMVGTGAAMREVAHRLRQVAATSLNVLLAGETGTGKELAARAIHAASTRAEQRFVAIDCGAIPDSLFESELFGYERGAFTGADRAKQGLLTLAEGGTLFLDEVENLSPSAQAKLLRVIQEREARPLGGARAASLDVRIIAATNRPLGTTETGRVFRQDLYFRLAEFIVELPPLRERGEDLAALAGHFLREASVELHRPVFDLDAEALALLNSHAWPGNVRELRNTIRQAVLMSHGPRLGVEQLRVVLGRTREPKPPVRQVATETRMLSLAEVGRRAAEEAERALILDVLAETGGNKTRAARRLQVDYKTLYTKLKRYGLGSNDPLPTE